MSFTTVTVVKFTFSSSLIYLQPLIQLITPCLKHLVWVLHVHFATLFSITLAFISSHPWLFKARVSSFIFCSNYTYMWGDLIHMYDFKFHLHVKNSQRFTYNQVISLERRCLYLPMRHVHLGIEKTSQAKHVQKGTPALPPTQFHLFYRQKEKKN